MVFSSSVCHLILKKKKKKPLTKNMNTNLENIRYPESQTIHIFMPRYWGSHEIVNDVFKCVFQFNDFKQWCRLNWVGVVLYINSCVSTHFYNTCLRTQAVSLKCVCPIQHKYHNALMAQINFKFSTSAEIIFYVLRKNIYI